MLTAERQRLETARPRVQAQIQRHLAWLEAELADLDQTLRDQTLRDQAQASPVWRERENLLRSVPGLGPPTALTLLAELPELRQVDHKAIAAFSRRLCAAGKPKKVALTACMHTLLTILNAIVRQAAPWSVQTAP
jgi:transposase